MELKERIKKLRKEKKWSQSELAEKSGVSAGMIGFIEVGKRTPSKDILKKLAEAFGVTIEYLEYGIVNNTTTQTKQSIVHNFLEQLVEEEVVKSINLDDDTRDMILKAVETEISLLLKKKEN